ncbi:FecR family protein [Chitinophaga pinensis]|uniref:DUF4974 domain-containing protein n=1 Tax=Chitinophaga pinensis TaxID=79329 RepID=A0A5C6LS18_9BACT|nr:FecR domain-containing protein [Chitinophaga pinensis]TWV99239.1 DUF4974 domain-containing protein [Chitinophaga pinensis]
MEYSKDYSSYTTNDFIADDAFLQWVRSPDTASDAWWQTWLTAHPHKQQQVDEARAFIIQLQFAEQLPDQDAVNASLAHSLLRIEAAERAAVPEVKQRPVRKLYWWAAAAALIAGIMITVKYLLPASPEMIKISGYAQGVRTVKLPDNSMVRLNAGAALSYRKDWTSATNREIWLQGEAFFDIKPSATAMRAAKGFVVHSGNALIDVLGTSFNVREGGAFTTVTLNTGKIRLSFNDLPDNPFILNPGDFVQYQTTSNKIIRKKVNPALYAVWKEERQYLEKITLQELAWYIEDTYNYRVKITDEQLAAQQLSGSLQVRDETSLLETLSLHSS